MCGFAGARLFGRVLRIADFVVFALEEEERAAGAYDNFFDFGDEDGVVAGILGAVEAALEVGEGSVKDGRAVASAVEDGTGFFGGAIVGAGRARVVFGDQMLVFGQDVHAETFFSVEVGVGAGALVDANENEHGIEGDRGKGVGGHAVDFILVVYGDDCDAGGEASQRFAEFGGTDSHAASPGDRPDKVTRQRGWEWMRGLDVGPVPANVLHGQNAKSLTAKDAKVSRRARRKSFTAKVQESGQAYLEPRRKSQGSRVGVSCMMRLPGLLRGESSKYWGS